jgi:preprotein translocase subunit Sss1
VTPPDHDELHNDRRGGGHETGRRIDDLIAQSHDPVQQATLLVLSKINMSLDGTNTALDSNTRATDRIAAELEKHRREFIAHDTDEIKRMSWLKGAWWAIVGLIGFMMALIMFVVNEHMSDAKRMTAQIVELTTRVRVLEFSMLRSSKDEPYVTPSR